MTYVVAVSGGVDSVVLLDMLTKSDNRLIVAHVDHGIRGEESAADARFVKALAKRYEVPFVSTALKLGPKASEEKARELRYAFLFAKAREFNATLVTAHHRDDMVETIALNLQRGTGWRGLMVLNRQGIHRPLLPLPKSALYDYACAHRLEWVEDATNATDTYARNKLRHRLAVAPVDATKLSVLRARQLQIGHDIDRESARLITKHAGSRYFMTQLDLAVAIELIGAAIKSAGAPRPTRPQCVRTIHAIKTAKAGTTYQVAKGISLVFSARKYQITVV